MQTVLSNLKAIVFSPIQADFVIDGLHGFRRLYIAGNQGAVIRIDCILHLRINVDDFVLFENVVQRQINYKEIF